MKSFRIIFFLLSSILLISSCSCPLRGYHKTSEKGSASVCEKAIVDTSIKTVVFKAKINVYNRYFSGLFLFKFMPSDSSLHVVLLSEVGLNLLDLEYKKEQINVVRCQDFLNKKTLLNTLKSDFLLLFSRIDTTRKLHFYENTADSNKVVKFRKGWHKFYYFCNYNNDPIRIFKKALGLGSINVLIRKDETSEIEEMNFKHRGIKLEINLVRLKKDE